jgi:hypothetical protein
MYSFYDTIWKHLHQHTLSIYIFSDLFDIHWFHNISFLELVLKLSLINTIIIIFCLFFTIFSHHFGSFLTSSCINKCLHWCVCNWYIELMGIHVVLLYPLKQTCLDPWCKAMHVHCSKIQISCNINVMCVVHPSAKKIM